MSGSTTSEIRVLQQQIASLLVYRTVLDNEVGCAFCHLLDTLGQVEDKGDRSSIACLNAYGQWFYALAARRQSWQDFLMTQLLWTDNPFTQQAQRVELAGILPPLVAAARHDLVILRSLYTAAPDRLCQWLQTATDLPTAPIAWDYDQGGRPQSNLAGIRKLPIWLKLEGTQDWAEIVDDLADYYRKYGTGIFAQYRALRWQAGQLVGIAHPDRIRLRDLTGYDLQKDLLQKNTEALIAGYPALHVLLYGSRGSGKSSLVKALLHQYGEQGLRLIEVAKSDLQDLVAIVEQLRGVPQTFIIFVDDLSFEEDEDAYKALKVVLEGNLTARPSNVVVYATSNRRHLIREFFGDRPRPSEGDEVHAWDTVQEKLSFSDRFGLTLTFEPANQDTYLAIVHHLAQQADLDLDRDTLEFRALQWATRHNGRSGRTARQFIDFLQAEMQLAQRDSR